MDSTLTEADSLFVQIMSQYGDPWRLSDPSSHDARGLEELRAIFRICISRQKRAIGPQGYIYFDYLSNKGFNALAATANSYDFVTIFSGILFNLYRLFFCFMSDPETIPTIGQISSETLSQDILSSIRNNDYTFTAYQHPVDDTRFRAAQNLALVSCILVLNHEIGHVVFCHPHLMQTQFNTSVYEEFCLTTASTKENQLRRAFEWEADSYAAVSTYACVHHIRDLLVGLRGLSMDYILSVSAFMLFLFIHKQIGAKFGSESDSHPAPRDRWLWMIHAIEQHDLCKKLRSGDFEIGSSIQDVATFWSRNKLFDPSDFDLSPSAADEMKGRYDLARIALREVDGELKDLESRRNEGGMLWRKEHKIEADDYAKAAIAHLANGVVGRVSPDNK